MLGGKLMNKILLTLILFATAFLISMSVSRLIGIIVFLVVILYLIYRNLSIIFSLIANRKYAIGNIDESFKWYEKASNSKSCSQNTKMMYAYLLLRQGLIVKSEKILKDVLNQKITQKDRINGILNLSLVSWKKGNLDEAIKLLQELYNENIRTTLIYQNLGYYLILKGDYSEALKFNLEAYEYSNDDASLLDNLAMNYYFAGDYSNALEIYDKLMIMNTNFVTVYYYYAKTLIQLERYGQALESLKQALNCQFSFLSYIKKEDIEREIETIKQLAKIK